VLVTCVLQLQVFSQAQADDARREFVTGKMLSHPNIVRTENFCSFKDGRCGIELELCSDGDLFDLVTPSSTKEMDEDAAHYIIIKSALALEHMHAMGIVHGDIKPENVLLHKGEPKLCDFGFCERAGVVREGKALGTGAYMAPELYVKATEFEVTTAQDVWSFGILLYAIIFADLPWERACLDDKDYALFHKSGGFLGRREQYQAMSYELRVLMSRMLAVNPAQRCTMADVVSFFSKDCAIFAAEGTSTSVPCMIQTAPTQPAIALTIPGIKSSSRPSTPTHQTPQPSGKSQRPFSHAIPPIVAYKPSPPHSVASSRALADTPSRHSISTIQALFTPPNAPAQRKHASLHGSCGSDAVLALPTLKSASRNHHQRNMNTV
jgi:serine/threonine protein kinase